ncbi:hypothetical protein V6N12_023498 [Hibiscus sabdariffa]|uniref:Uncharacterized protein n=1 Tax=Hibiscus sabdariffa TaxID=183260 RepID=A0ABR2FYA9_9ROSI
MEKLREKRTEYETSASSAGSAVNMADIDNQYATNTIKNYKNLLVRQPLANDGIPFVNIEKLKHSSEKIWERSCFYKETSPHFSETSLTSAIKLLLSKCGNI